MNGIAILGALPGSPAEECGLKYGDVLLSINGEPMSTVEDFLRVRAQAEGSMDILVRRGGHVMEFTLRLIKRSGGGASIAAQAMERMSQLRLVPPLPDAEPMN